MKITIKNLGVLRQAEFSLGKLTVICGNNNTGKTYATHATYGLLNYLRTNMRFPIAGDALTNIREHGHVSIPLIPHAKDLPKYINSATVAYTKLLPGVFAGNEKNFSGSKIACSLSTPTFRLAKVGFSVGVGGKELFQINSSQDNENLEVTCSFDNFREESIPSHVLEESIRDGIRSAVLGLVVPEPFLASAERTGAAIFQKELDFTRNRLVDLLGDKTTKIHPVQLLGQFKGNYPLAVRNNVDFIRDLPNICNRNSFILAKHSDLLDDFQDIIGGEYRVSKDSGIQYIPSKSKSIKLSLVESSSAVRSLLDVGFYLRHIAKQGDLFMIDEPELNLHPENQRKVARLFARLVHLGISVFMTTHSDYIIKEFNTLIMLGQKNNKRLQELAKREKYRAEELLNHEDVQVYIAEESLVKLDDGQRKTRCQTLVPATISPESGIDARSFDKTIEDMNRIQEEIVWGTETHEEEHCNE